METPPQSSSHQLFLRPPPWLPIAVAAVAGLFYIGGKFVETRDREVATITVSGDGKVAAVPDIAELSFGMQTGREPTAEVAMEKLQRAMDAVFAAVKAKGIEEKDIRTENFSLNPAYDWTDKGQIPRGFEANQSLRVKIRDLAKIGEVLSAATAAGANQAGGVSFTIDDPEALRAEAREQAITKAKAKAVKLAGDLGLTLGKLKSFSEGGDGFEPPMFMESRNGLPLTGGGGPLPVPAGEQEIVSSVSLTYEVR